MSISITDIATTSFKTSRSADELCSNFLKRLGSKVRYIPARLAISRSLFLPEQPSLLNADEDSSSPIRGPQLFGDGNSPAAWLALLTQHSGNQNLSRKEFQAIVAAHWKRGAELLEKDWLESGENLPSFVVRLADLANFSSSPKNKHNSSKKFIAELASAVTVPIGVVSEDSQTGEPVLFDINAPGGSPHVAIMGGTNSGKTYTATTMLKKLRNFGQVPLLTFDFKGDLADKLSSDYNASIVTPPRVPIPLDVLAVHHSDEVSLLETASRLRESIGRVKNSKLSGIQSDALREAIIQSLRQGLHRNSPVTIADVEVALTNEYQQRNRKQDELSATLRELSQFSIFEPSMPPNEFFSNSWIINLPQDGSAEVRRLVINLTLDALDRWLNSLPDSTVTNNRRAIRHITMLDEAHLVLATKLPALGNLVRMSRSKGGVVILVSQSPDDFEGEDSSFLDNMGLTLAFSTQAKSGPTKAIFGSNFSFSTLAVGEALCRIRTEAKTRRILSWKA